MRTAAECRTRAHDEVVVCYPIIINTTPKLQHSDFSWDVPCFLRHPKPNMSERSAISSIYEPIAHVVKALYNVQWSWYFSVIGRILAIPWRLVSTPLAFTLRLVLFVLAPVIHILSYTLSWFNAVLAFFVSLEVSDLFSRVAIWSQQLTWLSTSKPLYTFVSDISM